MFHFGISMTQTLVLIMQVFGTCSYGTKYLFDLQNQHSSLE